MKEENESLKLFQKALADVLNEKADRVLEQDPEKPVYSKRHQRAMKKILSGKQAPLNKILKEKRIKRRVIAILVAAALLLAGGLTVYAKQDAIVRFVTKIFDGYTTGSYREEPGNEAAVPDVIEQEYMPTYVPEGYELTEHSSDDAVNRIEWQNNDEEILIFSQSVIGTKYNLDNEHSTFETKDIGKYSVLIVTHEVAGRFYIWTDEKYSYSIHCSEYFLQEEISRMILSVSEKK